MSARTLGPEGGWIMRSHNGWGGERNTFTLPNRRVLKTLRGNPKGKVQRGQYLLVVGLGHYRKQENDTQLALSH